MATGIIQFLESQNTTKLGEETVNLLSLFEVQVTVIWILGYGELAWSLYKLITETQ